MKLTIGEKIALLRKEKNITQTELAEYLSLAPQAISRWEVGNGAPEITLLPRIAAFFGVSIDELFGLTSLKRAEDLVCKYSVLRDDRSFQEAMECLNSQLQTIDAAAETAWKTTQNWKQTGTSWKRRRCICGSNRAVRHASGLTPSRIPSWKKQKAGQIIPGICV